MKKEMASTVAAAGLITLLAACSGGGDSQQGSSSTLSTLPRPTPMLAGQVEVGGEIAAPLPRLATAATTSNGGGTLGAISTADPRSILGPQRAIPNPWNPGDIAALKLVTLPDGVRNRLPTGKWSKGFFYQSPYNLDAFYQFNPQVPADDPRNQGFDTNQTSIFPFPNRLNLDDRLGMVAISFPTRRYIGYGLDPNADVYNLSNPYRADTLIYALEANSSQDMRLSYVQPPEGRLSRSIDAFDELTVTTSWSNAAGNKYLRVIAAQGSPYVTVKYAGLRPVVQVGQGSSPRSEKDANGLPLPGKVDYTQQESNNGILAVAVGEDALQTFIENNTIRNTPALTGTKFRFIYQLPDRGRTPPGVNDSGKQPVVPLHSYKELVVYASSPITLQWDTPSRSYVASSEFNGVIRSAFVDDVQMETWTAPITEISNLQSFRDRRTILDRYANTFPTRSEIFLSIENDTTGVVRYKWAMDTMDGQTARADGLLMMGFDATHIPSLRNAARVAGLSYRSNFGSMSAVAGNTWEQTLTIPDILRNGASPKQFWMGVGEVKSDEEKQRLLKSLQDDTKLFTADFLATCNKDSYICGKYLHNVSRLLLIADYLQSQGLPTDEQRAALIAYLKRSLNLWLDGVDPNGAPVIPNVDTSDDAFAYDTTNGGLITTLGLLSREKDYTNREYVDHMFHYGYYIHAAAVLGSHAPEWLAENRHREKVNLLVRDIANPSLDDAYFPIARTFNWFRLQNIADAGPATNGGNTESSSESINSNYALVAWGALNGDSAFQALAAIMTAAEIRTAQAFYQLTPGTPYVNSLANLDYPEVPGLTVKTPGGSATLTMRPSTEPVMNILRDNNAETNTFFGPLLRNRIGINLLPIGPISDFVISRDWARAHAQTLLAEEAGSSELFDRIIATPPSVNSDCFLASWDPARPLKDANVGSICAGQLRILYSWRQLIVAANALNDGNGAYQRYAAIMDRLDADQASYRANTDRITHPGSSQNDGGVVADVLKDNSTPSTNTNTLWWVMAHR
jgi:endoglucanase Acf2